MRSWTKWGQEKIDLMEKAPKVAQVHDWKGKLFFRFFRQQHDNKSHEKKVIQIDELPPEQRTRNRGVGEWWIFGMQSW